MKNIYLTLALFCYFSVATYAQCNTEIGTLPTDTLFICENGIEIIPHEDYVLDENDALIYLLHTENGLEEVIDTFYSDEVAWQELGAINWNTMYFVSAIAGVDENMDGLPDDLNGECTIVSNTMPVVFAAPVSFYYPYVCNDTFVDTLCQHIVDVNWLFIEEIEYGDGNLERQIFIANSFSEDTVLYESQASFTMRIFDIYEPLVVDFQIIDTYGCSDMTISFDIYSECLDQMWFGDGYAVITDMPSELQVICDGEASSVRAGCIDGLTFPNPNYSLSLDSIYNSNSILATSDGEGRFTSQDAQEYLNQKLYVIGEVTETFWDNTFYSEPTPIVFLKPLEVNIHTLDCNSITGMATLEITPSGGLPEFDTNAFYNVEGDIEMSFQFGESQLIEVPLSAAMEWELDLTISDANECQELISTGETCVVNIENHNISNSYLQNIFPNPSNDLLHLQIKVNQNQSFSLQLWDVKGNKVFQENRHFQTGVEELTLNIEDLPAGAYYLKVIGKEGVDFRKVMIL